jgi:peroxiredoxin (alkyl hydroperoxide reductase subunit C)
MKTFPQIGKIAPNFVTVGVFKKRLGRIRLSDYRGKKYVMLIFYPANFTPVSPTELIALSDNISAFQKLSTQILAVSIDSPFSHLQSLLLSRKEGGLANLNYPLISDLSQNIILLTIYYVVGI